MRTEEAADYYSILGVKPDASQDEIRTAYVRRARVVHPDRFDPETQREDWQNANEMLRALNEAYEVLSNPGRRAEYDRARESSSAAGASGRDSRSSASPGPDADFREGWEAQHAPPDQEEATPLNEILGQGCFAYSHLPFPLQSLLRSLPDMPAVSFFPLALGLPYLLAASIPVGWLVYLAYSFAVRQSPGTGVLLWGSVICALLGAQALWDLAGRKTVRIPQGWYVTPLYLIAVTSDVLRFRNWFGLDQVQVEHIIGKYGYSGTRVHLHFQGAVETVPFGSREAASRFVATVRFKCATAYQAAGRGDARFFRNFAWLHGAPRQGRTEEFRTQTLVPLGRTLGLALVLMTALGIAGTGIEQTAAKARTGRNSPATVAQAPAQADSGKEEPHKAEKPVPAKPPAVKPLRVADLYAPRGEVQVVKPPALKPAVAREPVSLPNGTRIIPSQGPSGNGILTIENGSGRDAAVRICLVNPWTHERQHYRFVYVKHGRSVRLIHMAPGYYDLMFCTGVDGDKQNHRFRQDCRYLKFEDGATFQETQYYDHIEYTEMRITLHPVVGGNARTVRISEEEFHNLQ